MKESEKKVILIVDDEAAVRKVFQHMLVTLGYLVETAENAEVALQLCRAFHFDMVFTDNNMGDGLTGILLAKELTKKGGHHPVVVLASGLPITKEEAGSGVSRILRKPISFSSLKELADLFPEDLASGK
jgi:CheY-like chemotaxis protein